MRPIVLASTSITRRRLLEDAHVPHEAVAPRIDEAAIRPSLLAEGMGPRDIADALAQMKATKVAAKKDAAIVVGADQTGDLDGALLTRPASRAEAAEQLAELSGRTHRLHSAVVVIDAGRPVWRHVATARLTMRPLGNNYLESYLDRNWPGLADSVGGYKLEREGVRLFSRVEGDFFAVLGLPLVDLCSYLAMIGVIEG